MAWRFMFRGILRKSVQPEILSFSQGSQEFRQEVDVVFVLKPRALAHGKRGGLARKHTQTVCFAFGSIKLRRDGLL